MKKVRLICKTLSHVIVYLMANAYMEGENIHRQQIHYYVVCGTWLL